MEKPRIDGRGAAARISRWRTARFGLAGLLAGALTLSAGPASAQFELPRPLPPPGAAGSLGRLPGPPIGLACPDPTARITAEVISPAAGGRPGRVRILATVYNNGADYVSRPGQQLAQLYRETVPVTSRDFPAIGAAATADIAWDVDWLPGGEFNADFVLRLSYDPDIFIDALPTNDDCRMDNNEARLTAASIDALFRG